MVKNLTHGRMIKCLSPTIGTGQKNARSLTVFMLILFILVEDSQDEISLGIREESSLDELQSVTGPLIQKIGLLIGAETPLPLVRVGAWVPL